MHHKAHCRQNVEAMAYQRREGENQGRQQRKTNLAKADDKAKDKEKCGGKGKVEKARSKRVVPAIIVE